ncbi:MAG: hypothetical protein PHX21_07295 [bacterium]|nr:hypothetical protein [bacterium]
MWLLIIILHKEQWLDDLLSCLVEVGVESAFVGDIKQMKDVLAQEVPIFAMFKMGGKDKPGSKMIYALTDIPDVAKEITGILRAVGLDFEKKGIGKIITLKVDSVVGAVEED